jgi:hypothetical protein
MKDIEFRLKATEMQVIFTCTEQQVEIMHHVFDFLNGEKWTEQYSKDYDADTLDHVFRQIRSGTERILLATRAGRQAMIEAMRGQQ